MAVAATAHGGEETLFADDLTVHSYFPTTTQNSAIFAALEETQHEVHRWGQQNRVIFDASKEFHNVLHPSQGEGEIFRMLGMQVDPKLSMISQVDHILSKVRPRITAILRTRGKYCTEQLVLQYKTHILGLMEYSDGCIYHIIKSQLDRLDSVKRRFLHEFQIDECIAFKIYITLRRLPCAEISAC